MFPGLAPQFLRHGGTRQQGAAALYMNAGGRDGGSTRLLCPQPTQPLPAAAKRHRRLGSYTGISVRYFWRM